MAVLGKYVQTPIERKRYLLDYTDWFANSANPTGTIDTIVFASLPVAGTPAIVDAFEINLPDLLTVTIFISGGVNGSQYRILATMTTSDGQIKEDEIIVDIRNPPGT